MLSTSQTINHYLVNQCYENQSCAIQLIEIYLMDFFKRYFHLLNNWGLNFDLWSVA